MIARLLILPVVAFATAMAACTDPDLAATQAIGAYGFSQPEIVGSFAATFAYCSRDDNWGREFRAIGPTGVPVHGVVCGGLIGKGATLRVLP
jgi:hypothetical protein